MNDEIVLSHDTVELLVKHARAGLDLLQMTLRSKVWPHGLDDKSTFNHMRSTAKRGEEAIYLAERELFAAELERPAKAAKAVEMSEQAEKIRQLEDDYDFSDAKTDWIEGRRK